MKKDNKVQGITKPMAYDALLYAGRPLHLTLKKEWFHKIASGEKKEEYREIKQYWINRFTWHEFHWMTPCEVRRDFENGIPILKNKKWNAVEFRNGYSKDAPTMRVELLGIEIKQGKEEWGAMAGEFYFTLKLGRILWNNALM